MKGGINKNVNNALEDIYNSLFEEVMMIQLRDKDSGEVLGSITEDDLQFLIDNLEEESEDDTDYYINRSTLEIFKEKGTNETLIEILENALGDRDDMEIEWLKAD